MPTRGKNKSRQDKQFNNNKSYAAVHRVHVQRSSQKQQERPGDHKVILSFAQNHTDPSVLQKLKANKFIGSQVTHKVFERKRVCRIGFLRN